MILQSQLLLLLPAVALNLNTSTRGTYTHNSKQNNNILIEHTHNYTYKMDTAAIAHAAITLTHYISSLGIVSQPAVFTTPVNWSTLHDKLFQSHQLLNQPLTQPTALLVYSLILPHITQYHIM